MLVQLDVAEKLAPSCPHLIITGVPFSARLGGTCLSPATACVGQYQRSKLGVSEPNCHITRQSSATFFEKGEVHGALITMEGS